MKRLIASFLVLAAVPAVAAAQVYPDRIEVRTKTRAVITASYQGRDRNNSREEQTDRQRGRARRTRPKADVTDEVEEAGKAELLGDDV